MNQIPAELYPKQLARPIIPETLRSLLDSLLQAQNQIEGDWHEDPLYTALVLRVLSTYGFLPPERQAKATAWLWQWVKSAVQTFDSSDARWKQQERDVLQGLSNSLIAFRCIQAPFDISPLQSQVIQLYGNAQIQSGTSKGSWASDGKLTADILRSTKAFPSLNPFLPMLDNAMAWVRREAANWDRKTNLFALSFLLISTLEMDGSNEEIKTTLRDRIIEILQKWGLSGVDVVTMAVTLQSLLRAGVPLNDNQVIPLAKSVIEASENVFALNIPDQCYLLQALADCGLAKAIEIPEWSFDYLQAAHRELVTDRTARRVKVDSLGFNFIMGMAVSATIAFAIIWLLFDVRLSLRPLSELRLIDSLKLTLCVALLAFLGVFWKTKSVGRAVKAVWETILARHDVR